MKITSLLKIACISGVFAFISCSSDDDAAPADQIKEPTNYTFERDGKSSVSFGGQTTRIEMATILAGKLKDNTQTEAVLDAMFDHKKGANDFGDNADLNASTKSVRSKTAASKDYFSINVTDAADIKKDFDGWIKSQVDDVFPNWTKEASAGVAGFRQEAEGGSKRYITAKGLELNQVFAKSLIGGLMADQALNNYLGKAVLEEADNVKNNDNGTVVEGKSYTTMEHKWDEAYGYLFGAAPDKANPLANIGTGSNQKGDDSFLSKYLDRVNDDTDFTGIASDIFNAFKLGRAAIVAKKYDVRDAQAAIIREKVSQVIAVRAVYYLQQGKKALEAPVVDHAAAFHDLSEGYGFIYSLQFTRKPDSKTPYLTRSEVQGLINQLMSGTNGLWDVTPKTLQTISEAIAKKFSFTVAQAGS
ncbi:DUF4856 domain-containing protein [Aquimarina longa]|uniref:DUF4856 domain-containing protein n=1 Tax=Aquimarina longa TaxID=1080221 RepID=UPI0007822AC4|nr:DUF4856 domain-containing protein [Aquimarina longa]